MPMQKPLSDYAADRLNTRKEAGAAAATTGGNVRQAGSSLVGHDVEAVILAHDASLAFAHGNRPHVLVLVNDAHAEGGQGIPREGLSVVQDVKQGAALQAHRADD